MATTTSIKTWYLIHKWTSLICMVFLLLLCLTGLPLIFHHEIDHVLGYSVEPPANVESTGTAGLTGILEDAQERRPDEAMQFVVRDAHEPNAWFVRLGESVNGEISAFFTYDARTGEFLNEYPLEQGFMNVMLRLHVDMFAGLPGTLFLGFMGLMFVASVISGVVLYSPFMSRLRFGTVRGEHSSRIAWLDLHNLLGIVTLVWVMVVGVTGVINTLSIPIFNQWQSTQLAEMTEPYQDKSQIDQVEFTTVERAVDSARAAEPDMQLSFMAFPGNSFASPQHFVAFMQGTSAWTSQLLKPVLIDAESVEVLASRELPWYVTMLLVSQPLHFGDYGGMPFKVLWAILDLLTIVVLVSGLYLWLKRLNIPFESWLREAEAETPETAAVKEKVLQNEEAS